MSQNWTGACMLSRFSRVQLCEAMCEALCSPPGSSVHGILQARILAWVAIPFSRGFSQPTIEPGSLALQADFLPSEPAGKIVGPLKQRST